MQDPQDLVNRLGVIAPSPEQTLNNTWYKDPSIQVTVKRDDLLHPIISGNKWRKLYGHLQQAIAQQSQSTKNQHPQTIVSFGGGYSNHLHALGYCCHLLGIKLVAIVRGDYSHQLTPMLSDLTNWQVQVQFVTKLEYQKRDKPDYLHQLNEQYPNATIIPEGGSDSFALAGTGNILAELQTQYDYILCPVASGGTLAGLATAITASFQKTQLIGIGVLKGKGYLEELVSKLLPPSIPIPTIIHNYHCGGYAKTPQYLQAFCTDFIQHTQVPVEPVYSGKLFYALQQMINSGYFPSNSNILALHTGGLQGAR